MSTHMAFEARVRRNLAELAEAVEVSSDAWAQINERSPRRRARRARRMLPAAAAFAAVGVLIAVAAVWRPGDDRAVTTIPPSIHPEFFEAGELPTGLEQERTVLNVVCDRWGQEDEGLRCDELLGSSTVWYSTSLDPNVPYTSVSVQTVYGMSLEQLRAEVPLGGSGTEEPTWSPDPTRVRGHDARRAFAEDEALGYSIESVAWEEWPDVVVLVSLSHVSVGAQRPDGMDLNLLEVADAVVAGPLPSLDFVVARGRFPFQPATATGSADWLLTAQDTPESCPKVFVESGAYITPSTNDCGQVPQGDAIGVVAQEFESTAAPRPITSLLIGTLRNDTHRLVLDLAGETTDIEIVDPPLDLDYRYFAVELPQDTDLTLIAYGEGGEEIGRHAQARSWDTP